MKKILIRFQSDALGDTIAWFPYVEEYRLKHNLDKLYVYSKWDSLFTKTYPLLIFNPDESDDFFDEIIDIGLNHNFFKNIPFKYPFHIPLQKYCSDLLGFEKFNELRPNIHIKNRYDKKDYLKFVTIGIQSTAQAKYWNNPEGWDVVIDFLQNEGYTVYCLDRYRFYGNSESGMMNEIPNSVIFEGDIGMDKIISLLLVSDFFIGLSSGLSWLAWALGVPVVMISGFTHPINEFQTNVHRIFNNKVCNSCFNKSVFDRGAWDWCPSKFKKKERFECTKSIYPSVVISEIKEMIFNKKWYIDENDVIFEA
jgi:autotransporter strand-loop-strand O-heptosyltransferase